MIRQIVCELSMIYWTNLGLLNKINSIMRNQIIIKLFVNNMVSLIFGV